MAEYDDVAINHYSNKKCLAPDTRTLPARSKAARHIELTEGLQCQQSAYQDLRYCLFPYDPDSPPVDADLEDTPARLHAHPFAHDGCYREAGELLKNARAAIISTLNKLLRSTRLIYDFEFESTAKEFGYKIVRNNSHEELVPIANAKLGLSEDSIKFSGRYAQENHKMRDTTQQRLTATISTLPRQSSVREPQYFSRIGATGVIHRTEDNSSH